MIIKKWDQTQSWSILNDHFFEMYQHAWRSRKNGCFDVGCKAIGQCLTLSIERTRAWSDSALTGAEETCGFEGRLSLSDNMGLASHNKGMQAAKIRISWSIDSGFCAHNWSLTWEPFGPSRSEIIREYIINYFISNFCIVLFDVLMCDDSWAPKEETGLGVLVARADQFPALVLGWFWRWGRHSPISRRKRKTEAGAQTSQKSDERILDQPKKSHLATCRNMPELIRIVSPWWMVWG